MRAGSEHHVFDSEVAGLLHAPRLHALATHTILVFDGRLEHRNAQTLTRKRTSEGSTTDSTPDHDDIRYVAHPCPFRRARRPDRRRSRALPLYRAPTVDGCRRVARPDLDRCDRSHTP